MKKLVLFLAAAVLLCGTSFAQSQIVSRAILFEEGWATLARESDDELDRIKSLMELDPSQKYEVQCYCNENKYDSANERLSQQRAEAVVARLVKDGIAKDRLFAVGKGTGEPVVIIYPLGGAAAGPDGQDGSNGQGGDGQGGQQGQSGAVIAGGAAEESLTFDEIKAMGYSVKIVLDETTYYIFTEKGRNQRLDTYYIHPDGSTHLIDIYKYVSFNDQQGHFYDGEAWEDAEFGLMAQRTSLFNAHYVLDAHKIYCQKGYEKNGTTRVLDRVCDLYSGTYDPGKGIPVANYVQLSKKGISGSFAIWHGLTLKTVVEGDVQSICTALVIGDIPDDAFSRKVSPDWIK